MNNASSLASRFREVILNGKWIANTNFMEQLEGLDWQTANKQYASLNTIAALAQHIHYYIKGINHAFANGILDIKDQYSFDFPAMQSQQDWDLFLARFRTDAETFAAFVEQLSDEQLAVDFIDEKYGSFQRNIDAMIEHSYYHLGQLVLIKKLFLKAG